MRALAPNEKRTLRRAAIAIAIYLVLFGGYQCWKYLNAKRVDYRKLVQEANTIKREVQPYQEKASVVKTLMESFRLDPARLSKSSIVADASAAIQKAATSGGVQLGPIRETSARSSNKELANMQIEGSGPVPSLMAFLHNIQSLGYPLVIDSIQIHGDPSKPGAVKVSLTILILDFDQWKKETPNA